MEVATSSVLYVWREAVVTGATWFCKGAVSTSVLYFCLEAEASNSPVLYFRLEAVSSSNRALYLRVETVTSSGVLYFGVKAVATYVFDFWIASIST